MTALLLSNACPAGRVLQTYVAAGGSVWISGDFALAALKNKNDFQGGYCLSDISYSANQGFDFAAGNLVTDFLHIAGGDFCNTRTNKGDHLLSRARPAAAGLRQNLPLLEADSTLFFPYGCPGGVPYYEAQFQPAYVTEGGLDTIYAAETVRSSSPFKRSRSRGATLIPSLCRGRGRWLSRAFRCTR